MTVRVIGLIQMKDLLAFEEYRSQVGHTVERYQGSIVSRGAADPPMWNELHCAPFTAFVELEFPSAELAQAWSSSSEYQSLVPIRNRAMQLTLFTVRS